MVTAASPPLVRLSGVTKRFGERLILDNIDLAVTRGQTVALIGPSGGGKSTLIRCMNGLNTFDSGEIEVGDHRLAARVRPPRATAQEVRRILGMVFQDFQLFPHFTALENIAVAPRQLLGMPAKEARALGLSLLSRVGLGDRGGAYPSQLSGGQKQRVAIARALAMSPQGLLCDEITSALDPELKHEVLEVLEGLKREGMTLLMVTHEIGFARRAADRVLILAGGKIIEDGPPDDVIGRPQSPRAQQFLRRVLG